MSAKRRQLVELKNKMKDDKSLPLREAANSLVFGEGSADSEIMFIGEGPGYWEDMKGRPFVGNAGAFLNQLLASINVPREDVFITNVIHYRPPENRDPLPEELEAFEKYLDEMIEIISPKVIVTLGRFSMAKFIPGVMISSVHGRSHKVEWKGQKIWVMPMYHPAAGLRSTEVKIKTQEDFKKIPDLLKEVDDSDTKDPNNGGSEQMSLV